jgi:Ribonuclease G/E
VNRAVAGRVLIDGLPGETRAAVLDAADRPVELWIGHADKPEVAGNAYLGRVQRVDPALAAAFVELGLARPGFLPFKAAERRPVEGEALAVRVTREPAPGKGAKLSARDVPPDAGRGRPPRLIAARDSLADLIRAADPDEVRVEGAARRRDLQQRLPDLAARIAGHAGPEPLFDGAGLEAEIAALMEPEVALPGGGRLTVEPVTALTAIDVDAGAHAVSDPGRGALELDLAAADEIARQIRLRALSGLIVVDFLELETKADRRRVTDALQAALGEAAAGTAVSPMRASGLVEIARPRRRKPLHEILCCPPRREGDATALAFDLLRRAEREARANPGRALTLVAAPDLAAALEGPARDALDALARRLGGWPALRRDPARPRDAAEILLD